MRLQRNNISQPPQWMQFKRGSILSVGKDGEQVELSHITTGVQNGKNTLERCLPVS